MHANQPALDHSRPLKQAAIVLREAKDGLGARSSRDGDLSLMTKRRRAAKHSGLIRLGRNNVEERFVHSCVIMLVVPLLALCYGQENSIKSIRNRAAKTSPC